jgi:hypothetical protein
MTYLQYCLSILIQKKYHIKKMIFVVVTVLFSCLFYSFNQLKVDNEIYDPTGIVAPNAKLETLGKGFTAYK